MSKETGSIRIDEDREDMDGYGPYVSVEQIKAWQESSAREITAAWADTERAVIEGELRLRDPTEAAWIAADPQEHL